MGYALLSPAGIMTIFILLGISGIGALTFDRTRRGARFANAFAHGGVAAASLIIFVLAVSVIVSGTGLAAVVPIALPQASFSIRIDGLTALFLALLGAIGFITSIFGGVVLRRGVETRSLGTFGLFYAFFFAALTLLLIAGNAPLLLFAWESGALSAYFLITYDKGDERARRAGIRYLFSAHFALLLIAAAFFTVGELLGSYEFEIWRAGEFIMTPARVGFFLAPLLIGLALISGLFPFQMVYTKTFTALPAHVAALFPAALSSVALYALMRLFTDIFPAVHPVIGPILLTWGAVSLLIGALLAFSARPIRESLAAIGVAWSGAATFMVGAALFFAEAGLSDFFVFALATALYIIITSALSLSLLFLVGGVMEERSGYRRGEVVAASGAAALPGGLFLIGAGALAGVPPFPGFAAVWAMTQSFLVGLSTSGAVGRATFLLALGALLFALVLMTLTLLRAFIAVFVGPRDNRPNTSTRVLALSPAVILAAFLILSGYLVSAALPLFVGVIVSLTYGSAVGLQFPFLQFLSLAENFGSIIPLQPVGGLLLVTIVAVWLVDAFSMRKRKSKRQASDLTALPDGQARADSWQMLVSEPARALLGLFPVRWRSLFASPHSADTGKATPSAFTAVVRKSGEIYFLGCQRLGERILRFGKNEHAYDTVTLLLLGILVIVLMIVTP